MSAHAKEIGFDAIILFLDELILWLASYAADPVFVSREGQKVVKLVESDRADRPVPIISLVARQRDLRELVGQHVTGAERLAFADVLDHHEGRFSVITLEDRNLPAIAGKRILTPINDDAKRAMDDEFARTAQVREEVMNTLLTRHSNKEDFRKLYPFSPALVESAGSAPTISLQLSGVDAEQILAQAESVDNPGNRIRKLKDLLFKQMGVAGHDDLFLFRHKFRWKGTDRECDVVFGNLRDLPDETIRSVGDVWKMLIDYPFDSTGHSVRDDLARMEKFQNDHGTSRTICWVPSFFGYETQRALGIYVRLEQILKENQFPNFVQHLNAVDRDNARGQLENQRDQLKTQLVAQIDMAYGLRSGGDEYLDPSNTLDLSEHFAALDPSLQLQPPVAANMAQGVSRLLEQALRTQYPGHPSFEDEISLTKGTLTKVLDVVRGAVVGKLRKWTDLPQPMGLPPPVQDLVILTYAEQTNRIFRLHGGPAEVEIGTLKDEMVLEVVALPLEEVWSKACESRAETRLILNAPGAFLQLPPALNLRAS
jgi:hypothetical protein